jgi:hypothetical protein
VGLVGYGWAAKAHLAALLLSVVFLPVAGVRAAEPMVFRPAYAPAPAEPGPSVTLDLAQIPAGEVQLLLGVPNLRQRGR